MNASESVTSQSKRREESCTGRYLRGLRNQNGGHLVNLGESNDSELSGTFKSTNNINIKITCHSFTSDGYI